MTEEFAPAKVNLHLHVTGRRDDGYHLLDSLVVFAGVGDRLTLADADSLRLSVTGPFAAALQPDGDNLVLRAARMLADAAGIMPRGHLTLQKNLPIASGIGGGSADAAAALRLLLRSWQVLLAADDLLALAGRLGADVPVCLGCRPARLSGVGEVLRPCPGVPEAGLVLVNPLQPVLTQSVFRARTGAFSAPVELPPRGWPSAAALASWLRDTRNDLEPPARHIAPVITDVLSVIGALPGCLLARMSGSGATCFGLFASAGAAETAARGVAPDGWWTWGGGLGGF